jgi:hypothetical protein
MFAPSNPMSTRLAAGNCFARFVAIEDATQRVSICNALNQWMISSADKVSGATGDFTSSLEFAEVTAEPTQVGQTLLFPTQAHPASGTNPEAAALQAAHLESGSAKNMHCPAPLPSGF